MSSQRNCCVRLTLLAIAALIAFATAGCKRATPIPDIAPRFTDTVSDLGFMAGLVIAPLTLPSASGGNGALIYSVHPAPPGPGLTFDVATRTLSGTPTTAGTYRVDYKVEDSDGNIADGDADTLTFTISVAELACDNWNTRKFRYCHR